MLLKNINDKKNYDDKEMIENRKQQNMKLIRDLYIGTRSQGIIIDTLSISHAHVSLYMLFVWILISVIWFSNPAQGQSVSMIQVHYRSAAEFEEMVKPLMSPDGIVSADSRTNTLMVLDSPAKIALVEQFVRDHDQPQPQLTVEVKFSLIEDSQNDYIGADVDIGGDNWRITNTKKRSNESSGIIVYGNSERRNQQRQNISMIKVSSGSAAYIATGERIPYTVRWASISRQYALISETTVFQQVDTGFEVIPVLTGDQILVSITPRLSYVDKEGGRDTIFFSEAETQLSVQPGQWIEISSNTGETSDIFNEIFKTSRKNGKQITTIQLRIDN
jgi:hypothetical protein